MSKLCDQVVAAFKAAFPQMRVEREAHIRYRNQRLFLDIFVPQLALVIEVHGRQHDNYVPHFHGSIDGFRAYKRRDSLKEEWAAENGLTFISLRETQLPITTEQLLEIIDAASDG
jgi:very-short-patch-repair endonuclease